MEPLRQRQVHLDFHTSEHIPGVGSEFDPEKFVARLKEAAVDSVTCFSRCHHGWIYHDTALPNRHSSLTCNLLAEQIRACHQADIRVPIYITVGWDHLAATEHPEWVEILEDGRQSGRTPLGKGWGWLDMDFASPYVDYVIAQTQEVLDLFGDEVDGIFFDILAQRGVHSPHALKRFREKGWDAADPVKQAEMRELLVTECVERLAGAVRHKNKDCTLFFNNGHVGPAFRKRAHHYTHLELESLPSGGWGHIHFPATIRYARTLGKPCLGMTGKFSESWGHFGSFKSDAALEHECMRMLAHGAGCSVGDQLPPRGELDAKTYRLIGGVFRQVAELEPWTKGASAVTEIAVLHPEEFSPGEISLHPTTHGAVRALEEGRLQFDLVDTQADLTGYRLLVLPDWTPLPEAFAEKVEGFLAAGGAVLSTGSAGRSLDGSRFALKDHPAVWLGEAETDAVDYVRPKEALHPDSDTDFVMFSPATQLEPAAGAEVLATVTRAVFPRSWDKFVSHAHSPAWEATSQPAALQTGRIVHLAHPVFRLYAEKSQPFVRELILSAVRRLLPDPLVEVSAPTSLQATITRLGDSHVLHLLHYIPERRGLKNDVVEDRLEATNLRVKVRRPASRAFAAPSGEPIELIQAPDGVELKIPHLNGWFVAVLEA